MTEEIWREIPGWEGYYEASSHGRIRSLDRIVETTRWGWQSRKGKVMALKQDKRGYLVIGLRRDHGRKWYGVQHLVCLAFYGLPPTDVHQAAHFPDPSKNNNRVENLRWATPLENQGHRVVHGTHNRGENNFSARLTESDVREIRRVYRPGLRDKLADYYGICPDYVRMVANGDSWRHI